MLWPLRLLSSPLNFDLSQCDNCWVGDDQSAKAFFREVHALRILAHVGKVWLHRCCFDGFNDLVDRLFQQRSINQAQASDSSRARPAEPKQTKIREKGPK